MYGNCKVSKGKQTGLMENNLHEIYTDVEKAIDYYGDQGDMLIVISSSGNSKNMINAVNAARNRKFSSVVTLSGFSKDNDLNQLGDVNLWINSKAYNFVESIHQIWLLAIVDLIIGKREYSA